MIGQLTQEHDYQTNVSHISAAAGEEYYMTLGTDRITLWDLSHNWNRDVLVSLPSGYNVNSVGAVSRTLFDNDDSDIEFVVTINNYPSNPTLNKTLIVEEDSTTLQSFDDVQGLYPFKTKNGWKVYLYQYDPANAFYGIRQIWSAPGSYHVGRAEQSKPIGVIEPSYPNPAKSSIKIPVDGANKGEVIVYDGNGKILNELKFNQADTEVELNVEKYSQGVYYYKIMNDKEVIKSSKFIKL